MELPGCTDKDVQINLKDRVLSISSAKEQKEEKTEGDWLIKERVSSNFLLKKYWEQNPERCYFLGNLYPDRKVLSQYKIYEFK